MTRKEAREIVSEEINRMIREGLTAQQAWDALGDDGTSCRSWVRVGEFMADWLMHPAERRAPVGEEENWARELEQIPFGGGFGRRAA